MDSHDTYIVVPCKDEATRILDVLNSIQENGFYNIIVVDDGSEDETSLVASKFGAIVVRHPINLGAGAATQTGIELALKLGAQSILTIDGDTQHDPKDIIKLLDELKLGNDIVIGSRFLKKTNNIPYDRVIYNKIANLISYVVTGIYISDSQSGYRCMTREFAQANPLEWNGFEYCIEMLKNVRSHNYSIKEVPIDVKYTKETLKKGQGFWTGLKTLGRIISKNFHR